jgi:GR25 family glycosyltransferase involved in LPS biosynthesis
MVLGADSAYIIHLDKHKVRKRRLDHLINNLNLDKNKINWVEAIDKSVFWDDTWKNTKKHLGEYFWDPNGMVTVAILSCALSHRKAYKAFLDSGDEVGLFLEDDIKNTNIIHKLDFNKIREELDSINDWGVAIYGRYEKDIFHSSKITDNWYKNYYHTKQISGHAYALNRKSAQWLYDNTEKISYAADVLLEVVPFKVITLPQSIFVQRYKDFQDFSRMILEKYMKKYSWLKEFTSTTTAELKDKNLIDIYKEYNVAISNFIPAVNWFRKEKLIQGRAIKGIHVIMGDKNLCCNVDYLNIGKNSPKKW